MGDVFRRFALCFTLSLCISIAAINAQILQDTASLNLVRKGIDSVYNMHFAFAHEALRKISQLYPEHPIVILFKGIITYWENYPLLSNSAAASSFEKDMRHCIALCEKNKNPSYVAEYLLANLCARGLLLTFYTDNDRNNDVFPLATSTYTFIKRSFDFTSVYSDFFFFTGLYNYYREVYPKVHPVFKPLIIFFRKGNRIKGLEELQIAAQKSILLKAESFSDLSFINISYENNYLKASYFSKHLHDLYPDNPEYLAEYVKNLLLVKKYDEADSLVRSSGTNQVKSYFQAQMAIFKGIIEEKKYHDNKFAQQYYNVGVRDMTSFGAYGNEYISYACFGLSRIFGINGDKENQKAYHKRAMKLSDLKKINFD
jgi:hypothetical protein